MFLYLTTLIFSCLGVRYQGNDVLFDKLVRKARSTRKCNKTRSRKNCVSNCAL